MILGMIACITKGKYNCDMSGGFTLGDKFILKDDCIINNILQNCDRNIDDFLQSEEVELEEYEETI
jgi:hypothetical protein